MTVVVRDVACPFHSLARTHLTIVQIVQQTLVRKAIVQCAAVHLVLGIERALIYLPSFSSLELASACRGAQTVEAQT